MKTLYIECNMGCAGDMLTAALYELLEDKEGFLTAMNGLGLPGVRVEAQRASTCGIVGTRLSVTVHGQEELSRDVPPSPGEPRLPEHVHGDHCHDHHHDHCHGGHDHEHHHDHCHGDHDHEHHHDHCHDGHNHEHPHGHCHEGHDHVHPHGHRHAALSDIRGHIAALALPGDVKARALAVYDKLAAAESRAHGCPVDQVHFHEVGALDAVADVCGACYALSLLAPDRVVVSPVHVGSGSVRCAHGVVPVPAPAAAALLEGVPCYGGTVRGELCTPTGAALLTAFADSFGPMPLMSIQKTGYGVGSKEFGQANCVRAFLGESGGAAGPNGEITELVCDIDDMTPEALGCACGRLLELGALDVYTTPGQMKKGRPGWVLTVLCAPHREEELARQIFIHTTTNGLRARRCAKYFLNPHIETVDTKYGPVRVKRAEGRGVSHRKPEYDDVAALARKEGLPFHQIWEEVK